MIRLLLATILCVLSFDSYSLEPREVKQWKDDLQVYEDKLSHLHIDIFHSVPAKDFRQQLRGLRERLPSMSRSQVIVELMKITRTINDGHTSVPLWNQKLKKFPIKFKAIKGDFYVTAATFEHFNLLGAKLHSINGTSKEIISNKFSQIVPFSENNYSVMSNTGYYLNRAELLEGLGVTDNVFSVQFEFLIGDEVVKVPLNSSTSHDDFKTLRYRSISATGIDIVEKVNSNVWFGSALDGKAVYFKFRRYPSMSEMESLAEKLLAFINDNQSKNLIIDLRENYGGDFFIGLKLAQHLVLADSIDWKSGVYVLIDNETFSAAMSNAAQYTQILNAKLVGEPTGAKPSGYQDMGQFTLPNSNLVVTYSKRLYRFKDEGKDALYPDVTIPLSIDDYINGQDKPLNWIIAELKEN
ncbi:peptidase S41 [Kangiella marina]|uniref:S41 family peptidase n=1 Tax=Kangiella marina TaxID=1079178 RepID=A0ABP8IDD9_9GAMM